MLDKVLFVGIGGFIGASLRYWFSGWVQEATRSTSFPYGTLVVNCCGCLVIGLLSQLGETHGFLNERMRLLVTVGIVGGFTTFSTFSNESMNLLHDGDSLLSIVNIGLHVILGLTMVWVGRVLVHLLWR